MVEKDLSLPDVKQKIESLSNPSTSLETKKLTVELLSTACIKNKDFAQMLKENAVLVFTKLYKTTNDFDLKAKLTSLLVYLSVCGGRGASAENLMNDFNVLSLVNLFAEKDFSIFMQAFGGLKVLGDTSSLQGSSSDTPPKSAVSFSLSAATLFLENISALIDPASKLLTDPQKMEILGGFTQFVATGVMAQASTEAKKDSSSLLSQNFSQVYAKFMKTLESCHKGDLSLLDLVVAQILQLSKNGKLIDTPPIFGDNLSIVNDWLGGGKKFNLIYKATKDGFTAAAFHGKCDNKGQTVTIITSSEGHVFGGFAGVPWNSNNTTTVDTTGQSFLFSLKNPRNEKPTKFGVTNTSNAVYGHSSYGPLFGGGGDIFCNNNSNINNSSHTNFGGGYSNTTGLDGQTVFTGKYNFTAKEIEVYQVQ